MFNEYSETLELTRKVFSFFEPKELIKTLLNNVDIMSLSYARMVRGKSPTYKENVAQRINKKFIKQRSYDVQSYARMVGGKSLTYKKNVDLIKI